MKSKISERYSISIYLFFEFIFLISSESPLNYDKILPNTIFSCQDKTWCYNYWLIAFAFCSQNLWRWIQLIVVWIPILSFCVWRDITNEKLFRSSASALKTSRLFKVINCWDNFDWLFAVMYCSTLAFIFLVNLALLSIDDLCFKIFIIASFRN